MTSDDKLTKSWPFHYSATWPTCPIMDTSRRVVASRRLRFRRKRMDLESTFEHLSIYYLVGRREKGGKEGRERSEKRMNRVKASLFRKEGGCEGKKGRRGGTFRVLINCLYHRLLSSNLLSFIFYPFFILLLYFILRLPPLFLSWSEKYGSIGVEEQGVATRSDGMK